MQIRDLIARDAQATNKPLVDDYVESGERPVRRVVWTFQMTIDGFSLNEDEGGYPLPTHAVARAMISALNPYKFLKVMDLEMSSEVVTRRVTSDRGTPIDNRIGPNFGKPLEEK